MGTPTSTPTATDAPTVTPPPTSHACPGAYTHANGQAVGSVYSFELTNVAGGDNRAIGSIFVGWCWEMGQLLSVTIDGVPQPDPGLPAYPPWTIVHSSGVTFDQGEKLLVEMTFENNLNPGDQDRWPAWEIFLDDGCRPTSPSRDCEFPAPTDAPTPPLLPTGTPHPDCRMTISAGPVFVGDWVNVDLANAGSTSPSLDTIVVLWGDPGDAPLGEVYWGGNLVWDGYKFYFARLEGLSGAFPAGTTRQLRFHFYWLPSWLSFMAVFDNGCYVVYIDPDQPSLPFFDWP